MLPFSFGCFRRNSKLKISFWSFSWKSRNFSMVNFPFRLGPKKYVVRAEFTPWTHSFNYVGVTFNRVHTLNVFPVLAWSLCLDPMLVCCLIKVATFSNSSQSTSPSPFKSNIRKAISKWRLEAKPFAKSFRKFSLDNLHTHWTERWVEKCSRKRWWDRNFPVCRRCCLRLKWALTFVAPPK